MKIFDLGLIDFNRALDFQKSVFEGVRNNKFPAAIILCQHHPVITMGRSSRKENILAQETQLKNMGITALKIERGGDVTYHGPGQLMVYPIFNLSCFRKDIHWFLRQLEEVAIQLLSEFGVEAVRINGATGAWYKDKKIASIGITVKKWITYHGLAINIKKDDLDNFSLIRPCGMDIMMTSLESILGREVEIAQIKETLNRRLQDDQSCFA